MDERWFKQQQKRVGVTAEDIARELGRDRSLISRIYVGRQPMTLEHAKAFAKVLQVSIAEVLERAGVASDEISREITGENSDGDVVAWAPSDGDRRTLPIIAQAFGQRDGVDVWAVKTGAMALQGYFPGDYVLVDTHQSERVRGGDVVVAQIYDNAKSRAVTVLRRLEPPVLVAASLEPADRRVHVVDGVNVVVRGKVIASWRMTEDVRQLSNHERRWLERMMRDEKEKVIRGHQTRRVLDLDSEEVNEE